MKPIRSLAELRQLAKDDPKYDALAAVASSNLGGPRESLQAALNWLETMAKETSEAFVVEEVNFVIDLVPEELARMNRKGGRR